MNKKTSRLLSLVLTMVMTFSCVVFSGVNTMAKVDLSNGGTLYTWFVGKTDITNNNGTNDSEVFTAGAESSKSNTISGGSHTINISDKSFTVAQRGSDAAVNITVAVPAGASNAKLYFVCEASGTGRTVTLSGTNYSKTFDLTEKNTVYDIMFDDISAGTYTLSSSGKIKYSFLALEASSAGGGEETTESTTEVITEEPTEATSETPVETTTEAASQGTMYKFYVNSDDATNNGDNQANNATSIFTDAKTGTGKLSETSNVTIEGKEYTFVNRNSNSAHVINIVVPEGVSNATFYIVANSSGSGTRKLTLTDSVSNTVGENSVSGTAGQLFSFNGLNTGNYKLTYDGNGGYSFLGLFVPGASGDETTTETTTLTTTETTTEATTEATTYALNLNMITGDGAADNTDVNFTVNDTNVTAKTGVTTNIAGIKPGETYVLTFTSAVSKFIYNWSDSFKASEYNSKAYTLTYNAPADLSGDVNLELTYATGKIFVEGEKTEPGDMGYGTYGIGDYKHSITDYNAENYLAYKTLQYNLYDIGSGNYNVTGSVSTNNLPDQRLLISTDAGEYIKFKVNSANDSTTKTLIYLDVSNGAAKVSVDNSATGNENAGIYSTAAQSTKLTELSDLRSQNGEKAMFYVTDGTYIINGADASKLSVVKSLRLFQIDNKTGAAANDIVAKDKAVEIYSNALSGETISDNTLFARIIGQVDAKGNDDFEQINRVGFTFVNADEVDAWESASGLKYNPNIDYASNGVNAPTHKIDMETTTVYDAVYDITNYDSSKVSNGRYTGDASSQAGINADKTYFEVLVFGSSDMKVYAYAYTDYVGSDTKTYLDGNGNSSVQSIEISGGSINVTAKQ